MLTSLKATFYYNPELRVQLGMGTPVNQHYLWAYDCTNLQEDACLLLDASSGRMHLQQRWAVAGAGQFGCCPQRQ